jgi:hypothetical protein
MILDVLFIRLYALPNFLEGANMIKYQSKASFSKKRSFNKFNSSNLFAKMQPTAVYLPAQRQEEMMMIRSFFTFLKTSDRRTF